MRAEDFLENLGAQAEEERLKILAAADEEAKEIRERGEVTAAGAHGEVLAEAQRRSSTLKAAVLNDARLEAARIRLEAQHRLVEDLFLLVRARIAALDEAGGLSRILSRLVEECVAAEGGRLVCRGSDRKLLEKVAGARGFETVVSEEEEGLGGITVHSADGRFVERNTFEDRLRKARPWLEQEISRRLFRSRDPRSEGGERGGG